MLPLRGGGSRSAQPAPRAGRRESVSLTAGISTSTAWGVSTSRATGDSESLARSLQRSRELVVEPSELQRLPVTAMIVSYGAAAGRRVLLADANPAIGALPVATLAPLAESAAGAAADGRCAARRPAGRAASRTGRLAPTSARRRGRTGAGAELTGPSRGSGGTPPAGRR